MNRKCILACCALLVGTLSWAQVTSDFTVTANPSLNIPLGPSLADGTPFYSIGGGVSVKGEYSPPFAQVLYTGIVFDADLLPINSSSKSLTLLSLGLELGLQFYPIPRLGFRVAALGGEYAGMLPSATSAVINPFVGGLADVTYLLSPSVSIGVGASYRYAFTPTTPVYQGIGVTLGVQYHIGAGGGAGNLRVEPAIRPIFPLFYNYYDKNPAGSMTIRNTSTGPIQDVQVSFFVRQFMDQPKVTWTWKELARGEEKTFDVFALFKDNIFGVTEATKVAGEIKVAYKYFGTDVTSSYPVTISINNRNSMTWDDTRKAAAFITSNDMNVRSFAARAVPDARSRGTAAVNTTFRAAMALFDAMRVQGIAYVPDPKTFATKVENKEAVDYLQFPAQTLETRAGDCDDLSILYASLLESAGIETAFITVPGHIYTAFNVGLDPKTAGAIFLNPGDLIIRDKETWVPVEITRVKDGFLKAWQNGAQEWRAATASQNAELIPVHDAWERYSPANAGDIIKVTVSQPDSERVFSAYSTELKMFWTTNFQPRVTSIQNDLKVKQYDAKLLNKLGVLYARFGMYNDARKQFESLVANHGEVPTALINLGNLAFLDSRHEDALDYFTRALKQSAGSSVALQGIAMAGYELGDTNAVETALEQLKKADPEAASRLASLGGGGGTGRAASAEKEITSWNEE
jgi:transglutaminase-like putative cysteine protease